MKNSNKKGIKQWINTIKRNKIYQFLYYKVWMNVRIFVQAFIIIGLLTLRGTGMIKYIIMYYVGWCIFALVKSWKQIISIRHYTETVLFGRPLHLYSKEEWKSGKVKMKKCDWSSWRKKKNDTNENRKGIKKRDKK